eukprot:Pgem_evm1s10349
MDVDNQTVKEKKNTVDVCKTTVPKSVVDENNNADLNILEQANFKIYDIVFARLKGYVPWPAIVCPDPESEDGNQFIKIKKFNRRASRTSEAEFNVVRSVFFHVVYFGPALGR